MLAAYLGLQLGVVVAMVGLWALSRLRPRIDAGSLLGLHYLAVSGVIVAACIVPWMPAGYLPAIRVTLADNPLLHDAMAWDAPADLAATNSFAVWPGGESLAKSMLALSVLVGIACALRRIADWRTLRRLMAQATLLRRHGHIRIWVSDEARAPFSFRSWSRAHVVVPQFVVLRPDWYRMALAHELQHHRQGDTAWLYLFGALPVLCALNPCAWLWTRSVARLQEMACDASLLRRPRWRVDDYANTLLDVARAAAPHRGLAWATSLIDRRHSLQWRIEYMTSTKFKPGRMTRLALIAGALAGIAMTAATASSLMTDARSGTGDATSAGAMPVRGGLLAAAFEPPEEGATRRQHAGVDIAAPAGTLVHAWRDGKVLQAGTRKGCGTAVLLEHSDGARSRYCNLARLRVATGDDVRQDQRLGELADLGEKTRAHLHFEIEMDGRHVDPARYLETLARSR